MFIPDLVDDNIHIIVDRKLACPPHGCGPSLGRSGGGKIAPPKMTSYKVIGLR